jgi:imidazolonepropionase-like amidohydrolase
MRCWCVTAVSRRSSTTLKFSFAAFARGAHGGVNAAAVGADGLIRHAVQPPYGLLERHALLVRNGRIEAIVDDADAPAGRRTVELMPPPLALMV